MMNPQQKESNCLSGPNASSSENLTTTSTSIKALITARKLPSSAIPTKTRLHRLACNLHPTLLRIQRQRIEILYLKSYRYVRNSMPKLRQQSSSLLPMRTEPSLMTLSYSIRIHQTTMSRHCMQIVQSKVVSFIHPPLMLPPTKTVLSGKSRSFHPMAKSQSFSKTSAPIHMQACTRKRATSRRLPPSLRFKACKDLNKKRQRMARQEIIREVKATLPPGFCIKRLPTKN